MPVNNATPAWESLSQSQWNLFATAREMLQCHACGRKAAKCWENKQGGRWGCLQTWGRAGGMSFSWAGGKQKRNTTRGRLLHGGTCFSMFFLFQEKENTQKVESAMPHANAMHVSKTSGLKSAAELSAHGKAWPKAHSKPKSKFLGKGKEGMCAGRRKVHEREERRREVAWHKPESCLSAQHCKNQMSKTQNQVVRPFLSPLGRRGEALVQSGRRVLPSMQKCFCSHAM